MIFITPKPLEILSSNFGPVGKTSLGAVGGQKYTPLSFADVHMIYLKNSQTLQANVFAS